MKKYTYQNKETGEKVHTDEQMDPAKYVLIYERRNAQMDAGQIKQKGRVKSKTKSE